MFCCCWQRWLFCGLSKAPRTVFRNSVVWTSGGKIVSIAATHRKLRLVHESNVRMTEIEKKEERAY